MIETFGLVACSKSKRGEADPEREFRARRLYDSWLFDGRVDAVETHCEAWAIFSAKHGYVDPDEHLSWYDKRITDLPPEERVALAEEVVAQLPETERVMLLMGRDYARPLKQALPETVDVWDPLEGVRLFDQRSALRNLADTTRQATLVEVGQTEATTAGEDHQR